MEHGISNAVEKSEMAGWSTGQETTVFPASCAYFLVKVQIAILNFLAYDPFGREIQSASKWITHAECLLLSFHHQSVKHLIGDKHWQQY